MPPFEPEVIDRARGAMLGLAVGDALGATLEFSRRDKHPHHTEITGGGPFGLQPGQWTDDTAMTLALANSLIRCGTLDPHDLMTQFVSWYRTGTYSCTGTCFDIGTTTREALHRFELTGNPFSGSEDEYAAGNGSLMRVAPVALVALHDEALARQIAADQSRTTHAAQPAIEACELFVTLLRSAILGQQEIVRLAAELGRNHPTIRHATGRQWEHVKRDDIASTGYVVTTFEASLWAIARTSSFEQALVLAVNLGGDADTIGAVTGQLAGAIYGASAIPKRWLACVAWRHRIDATSRKLLTNAQSGARLPERPTG